MLRLFRHYIALPAMSLAALEAVIFFFLLNIPLLLERVGLGPVLVPAGAGTSMFAVMTGVALLALCSVGLYNRNVFSDMGRVVHRSVVVFPLLLIGLLALAWVYARAGQADYEPYYVLCTLVLVVFFPITLLLRGLLIEASGLDAFRRRLLVVGVGSRAGKIDELVRSDAGRRVEVVGWVTVGAEGADAGLDPLLPADIMAESGRFLAFLHRERVDEIVLAVRERRGLPVWSLFEAMMAGVRTIDYHDLWERETGSIDLDELSPAWLVFSDGFRVGTGRRIAKRLLDLVVGALILVATLPLTLATALAIRIDSRGPILFRQERMGRDGRVFQVLKFRSMVTDAEKDGVPRWAGTNDSRVTRVGAIIRKLRIDEIPQVINVLKGDMSLIGPRPERPFFVEGLARTIPHYQQRHRIKPGITGWAQINFPYGASEEDAKAKLAYDLYYLKNGGIFLDLVILVQTVRVILWGEGAR